MVSSSLKNVLFFFVAFSLALSNLSLIAAGYGFKPLTTEHLQRIDENFPHISEIKPNKVGVNRIKEHRRNQQLEELEIAPSKNHHEEYVIKKIIPPFKLSSTPSFSEKIDATPLPHFVDNSQRISFPPIGDQRLIGSCVAWATTYYQATHEIGLLNHYNNKMGFKNVLSPKWTYNLLNDGQDEGLIILDAYDLLSNNGAVSIVKFPYDNNYLEWTVNPKDWVNALSNRTTSTYIINGLDGDLTAIKQALNNGHVLTFATFVDSWIYSEIKHDPANPTSSKEGELAVIGMNGSEGGHCLTIVGYDDNLWIDVNENGQVDAGERGAFLIANSWGSSWGNRGFIWISYDAFKAVSSVSNGPSHGRIPLAAASNSKVFSVLPKKANYSPLLVALFNVTQGARNLLSIKGGISDINTTTRSKTLPCAALSHQGGNYDFIGTSPSTPESATFALDLTDLIDFKTSTNTKRYYLLVSNKTSTTKINSFELRDRLHKKKVVYQKLPILCTRRNISPYLDYSFTGQIKDKGLPVVKIVFPHKNDVLHGNVEVHINAKDKQGIERVELLIDSELYAVDDSPPYLILVDTKKIANGEHQLTAIAYDQAKNSSSTSINVNIKN